MSIDKYSTAPANNDLTNYFKTGMRPSSVKNAGWDIMADLASYIVSLPTAGGTANALTVSNGRPFGALVPGLLQILNPTSVNTGPATFAPDGLGAANIHAWGKALIGGEMRAGVPAALQYDGISWNLKNPSISPVGLLSGALEATVFTTSGNFTPTATANYLVIGIGGGGGGGGGSGGVAGNGGAGGGGGGGGAIGFSIVPLSASTVYAVVIGAGGSGGSNGAAGNAGAVGSAGSPTIFNGVTIALGGNPGAGSPPTSSFNARGFGGGAGSGYGGGQGGFATAGIGPAGGSGITNTGGGGGGGGGGANASSGGQGGTGGSGILIVIRA